MDKSVLELSGWYPYLMWNGEPFLPTYYLVISLTFCFAIFWLVRRAEARNLSRISAMDIALAVMIGGFFGARLLHVVFEAPHLYLEDPRQIYRFWEGGFVWYGGALAGALAGYTVTRVRGWPTGSWLDVVAPIAAAGYAMGRLACVLTGCCFGDICHLASGFAFRYPTQLFAVVWDGAIALCLLYLEPRRDRLALRSSRLRWLAGSGALFVIWIWFHAIGRLIMESFRADNRGPLLFGFLSVSTFVSCALLVAAGYSSTLLNKTPSKK